MASFEIDRQTIKDLDLFNEEGRSVFSFFNNVKTIGGRKQLETWIQTPSFNIDILSSRRNSVRFFYDRNLWLDINKNDVDYIEYYLTCNLNPLKPNIFDAYVNGLKNKFSPDKDYYTITRGIADTIRVLKVLAQFYNDVVWGENLPLPIIAIADTLFDFFSKTSIKKLLLADTKKDMRYVEISYHDNLFRKKEKTNLRNILNAIYDIDAYIAIAEAVRKNEFCFPEYNNASEPYVQIAGLHHPCIKDVVKNDVIIQPDKNICFLTGANMAGKSSYLKALGLSIYLAHVGFPVPATQMQTTLFKGLITTINLSDNINSGYSHYYSEIKRLKKVAEKIRDQGSLFVIFDELFRGTNVKDAYDASLATIIALSEIKDTVFLISTHIVEIATELKEVQNISFKYFNTKIEDDKPIFDYKLIDGVSSETLGYFIFKKEGIVQILEQAASK